MAKPSRTSRPGLEVEPRPTCPMCGDAGMVWHAALDDGPAIFQGAWSFRRCQRRACGHGWLDPAPTRASIARTYEGYGLHAAPAPVAPAPRRGWTGRAFGLFLGVTGTQRRRRRLETYNLGPGQGRLLEVGCGNGARLAALRSLGYEVEGQEVARLGAATASRHGVPVHTGDLASLGLPSARFDLVVMNHVLEHVHDPVGLLAECFRLLRPGGRFVSVQPNGASAAHRRYGRDWVGLDPPRHLHLFSPASVRAAAQAGGFGRIRVRTTAVRAEACAAESLRRRDQRKGGPGAPRYREMALAQIRAWLAATGPRGRGDEIVLEAVR